MVQQTNNNEAAKVAQDNTVKQVIFIGGKASRRSAINWQARLDKAAKRLHRRK